MKYHRKAVKTISYVAGIFAIASALLVMVLFIMSALGLVFPRKEKITLHTDTLSKIYDAAPLSGGVPTLKYGSLHPGHKLVVTNTCDYTNVGEYKNQPAYIIVDASGADVTEMYDISTDFGDIIITARPLTVRSLSQTKRYDGTALISGEILPLGGSLVKGHSLVCHSATSITYPGEQAILPTYSIVDENGADVTDQYSITNDLGTLTVLPLVINIQTDSAEKNYDGKPLSADGWKRLSGPLLKGHTLSVECITEVVEVGSFENMADVRIEDENGNDVSELYEVNVLCGTLTISPLPLHIVTGSMTKEYDGKDLSCETWRITSGSIGDGERITLLSSPALDTVGSIANEMHFAITDQNGDDISHRYQIMQDAGTLSVTPRAITIRTGSASKVYDGTALTCEEYEIIKGSLSEGDMLEVAFTSIVGIGYTQNYIIDYSIYRISAEGQLIDVSGNYRFSYDYGTLTVMAN